METSYVKIEKVEIREGFNVREDFGDMKQLKTQLLAVGMTEPVRVQFGDNGKVLLGAQGHRRLKALQELKAEGHKASANGLALDFYVMPEDSDITENDRNLEIITGNTGKPLEMLEAAVVFLRLIPADSSAKEREGVISVIAEQTGFSKTHIKNTLTLLTAPAGVLTLIKQGKATASFVIEVFLDKKDWDKTLDVILAAIADAEQKGKKKASKKNLKDDADESDENEEPDPEDEEKKTELKRIEAITKRVERALGELLKLQEEIPPTSLEYTVIETAIVALVHVSGEIHPNEPGFEPSLGDVKVHIRSVIRNAESAHKTEIDTLKASHKEELLTIKEAAKAKVEQTKEKAAAKVAAVKEKAAAK